MMDPGQDLLLAALSESGICPNDLFDIDSQDTVQSPASQQVNKSILVKILWCLAVCVCVGGL